MTEFSFRMKHPFKCLKMFKYYFGSLYITKGHPDPPPKKEKKRLLIHYRQKNNRTANSTKTAKDPITPYNGTCTM